MKIAIIGHSGSGKSTLAKILSDYYDIPLLYLDTVQFDGDIDNPRDITVQKEILNDFLNKHDSWVIDGNYYALGDRRFLECDEIFYLDYNRFFCFYSAYKRYQDTKGEYRHSLGAIDKFDLSFKLWILYEGRKKEYLVKHLKHFNMCQNGHHFKNRKALNQYLIDNKIIK